jgi:hypothetical protein
MMEQRQTAFEARKKAQGEMMQRMEQHHKESMEAQKKAFEARMNMSRKQETK